MSENLLYTMMAAIGVAMLAIVVQAVVLCVIARTTLRMKKQVSSLIGKIEPVLESSEQLIVEVRTNVVSISAKANEIMDLSRKQLDRVDEVLGEATARTRVQMDRIEMVLDDTVNRFQETTSLIQQGILKPLRQLNAITAGIRVGLSILTAGHRRDVTQAIHDDEMFI
ncbi:MAG: hypothetical protein ABSG25_06405 [Bryobacteraceae bacterium]|jgi:hypothetical protein